MKKNYIIPATEVALIGSAMLMQTTSSATPSTSNTLNVQGIESDQW